MTQKLLFTSVFAGLMGSVVLNATPAHALSFNFSFQDNNIFGSPTLEFVTGTVDGLVEGNNSGVGITAEVLSSPTGQGLGTYTFADIGGSGSVPFAFVVTDGSITLANARFLQTSNVFLSLGTPISDVFGSQLVDTNNFSYNFVDVFNTTTTFTPVTPVPFEFSPALGLGALGAAFVIKQKFKKKLVKKAK